jgi:hypothetical protein
MRPLVEGEGQIVGYARMIVDRGAGRTFLKPPRAIASGEHMASYLLCDRGFVPTITLVLDRDTAASVRYNEALPFAQDTDFAIRLYLSGCSFVMAEEPGAIWRDQHDPKRASAGRKSGRLRSWLETLKPLIPAKAYYGAGGWLIAKGVAKDSVREALRLYGTALWHGCYGTRLAFVVFLQIFLPDQIYRALADRAIATFHGAIWSRRERNSALAAK